MRGVDKLFVAFSRVETRGFIVRDCAPINVNIMIKRATMPRYVQFILIQ